MEESNLKSGVEWIICSGDKVGGDPVVRRQEFREDRLGASESQDAGLVPRSQLPQGLV